MCALVRHGPDDGLRAEEPSEAAGDRQRRCVCLWSAVCMFTAQHRVHFCSLKEKFTQIWTFNRYFSHPHANPYGFLFLCNIKAGILKSVFSMQCQWMVTEDVKRPKGLKMTIKYYNQYDSCIIIIYLKSYCSSVRETDLGLSQRCVKNFS